MLHIHTDTDLDKVKQRHHDQHANNQTKKPEAKKNMITTQKRTKQTTETDYTASKREYL